MRPKLLLELGTRDGVSFATFCQAVTRANVPAHCYAVVDEGDIAPAIADELGALFDSRFSAFATLLRGPVAQACDSLDDGSIDLLHIDCAPTADSADQLYAQCQSKLSGNAVVLLHGTNDLSTAGSGGRQLWRRLREQYPCFEFTHGRGLGVLAVGGGAPEPVRALCSTDSSEHIAALRSRFSQLGERWVIESRQREAEQHLATLSVDLASRDDAEAAADALKARIKQAQSDIAQAQADAAQARLDANRDILAEQARVDEVRREATRTRENALQLIEATRKESEQDRIDSARLADAAITRVEARHRSETTQLRSEIATTEQATAELRKALQTAQAEIERAEAQAMRQLRAEIERGRIEGERLAAAERERARTATAMTALTSQLHRINAEYASVEAQLTGIRASTVWKLTWPLRGAGQKLPVWFRCGARRAAKLAWWTVTLQLSSKMRLRQQAYVGLLPVQASALTGEIHAETHAPWPDELLGVSAATWQATTMAPQRRIRLVYVSGEADTPGHTYRVERFVSTAIELGHSAIVITPLEIPTRLGEIEQAQILLLWRTTWSDEVAHAVATARRAGARVVFDVDDLMFDPSLARSEIIDAIRSASLNEAQVGAHFSAVQRCIMEADICVTTTEELAFQLRGLGKRTHVLPNSFDRSLHATARRARLNWRQLKRDSLVRIGYAGGSRTHQRDFGCAVEAIAKLMREVPHVSLVLFQTPDGQTPLVDVHEFPALTGLEDRIEWRSMQTVTELPNELARFDVNIAPLEFGNPFCEGKSELKFWEAALVEVPTVASPTGPFRRAIRHGKTGFLAASADDWFLYLRRLVEDVDLRFSMGREAYYAALSSFGPIARRLRYSRVIEQLMGGQAAANAFALDAHLASRPKRPVQVFPSDVVFHKPAVTMADVTVVVPLYNYEQHVVEALDSVAAQTLGVIDLVIVEGCSTDNSLAIAKAWAERNAQRFNRLLLLHNQANYGLAFCRNSGFDAADTPYVMPLDADNRLRPACCETLLGAIREKSTSYVYPSIQLFGDSAAVIGSFPYDPKGFVPSNYIDAMAMVDREAWAFVGGYDHVRHGWEDYDFWCRLAETGLSGSWHPEVLAEYRVHNRSIIRTLENEDYRRLFEDFTSRHPWVSLGEQQSGRRPPPSRPQLTGPGQQSRLDTLLPLLRCPQTHEKLAFDEKREALVNLGGLQRWPLVDGRPVLVQDAPPPAVSEAQEATPVPQRAIALADAVDGYVLHLNTGGGLIGLPKVIAVDTVIYPNTDVVADAHDLPFDDETVSAVILCSGLEQFRDAAKVAAEIYRVLKPHGQLFIQASVLNPDEAWLKDFQTDLKVSDCPQPHHSASRLATGCQFLGHKGKKLPDLKTPGR
jgi:glycosyltransferase involved in cell wall biosynthesis